MILRGESVLYDSDDSDDDMDFLSVKSLAQLGMKHGTLLSINDQSLPSGTVRCILLDPSKFQSPVAVSDNSSLAIFQSFPAARDSIMTLASSRMKRSRY